MHAKPLMVPGSALARALALSPQTIRNYLTRGWLRGINTQAATRYFDPARKTTRGRWLIELASVEELLVKMYDGSPVPPAIRRRLRAMAKPLPSESP